jgi:transcriptional regulator with XRE-family HTH domain
MFYDKLKRLCLEQGISVSKMAVDLKISTTTVTGWKRGAKPQPAQVKKIAEYFKVFPDELTRETPDGAPVVVSRDDRADLVDIIKSQQEAIRNLSESVRNLSDVSIKKCIAPPAD